MIDMADGRLDVGESAGDLARDIAGAQRDRVELGALLLEHVAKLGIGLVDQSDRVIDLLQSGGGALDGLPNVLDLLGNIVGRLSGLRRELLHSGRDHGEALARVAGAHRLDAGVQSEQRRLPRDRLDEAHHLADSRRGVG